MLIKRIYVRKNIIDLLEPIPLDSVESFTWVTIPNGTREYAKILSSELNMQGKIWVYDSEVDFLELENPDGDCFLFYCVQIPSCYMNINTCDGEIGFFIHPLRDSSEYLISVQSETDVGIIQDYLSGNIVVAWEGLVVNYLEPIENIEMLDLIQKFYAVQKC
jgi:hypothetical protein